jgi:flagellar P-ring protein precursor FlgI
MNYCNPNRIAILAACLMTVAFACQVHGQQVIGGNPANALQQAAATPALQPNAIVRPRFPIDRSSRIKDITLIAGDRNNHTSGNGLVFGLSGTGGTSDLTLEMARNYFARDGLRLDNLNTQNLSSVLVSGKIPPYARKGETIIVNVAVADDASSLRGGYLHRTALRGLDNEIYAIAQGPIVGGGVSAGGAAASVQKNHPTAGTCEAIIEREICSEMVLQNSRIRLVLQNKDYSTATQIANAINEVFPQTTRALDAGTVELMVPRSFHYKLPAFISMVGELRVRPDMKARVIINQKTGTILMGQNVRLSRVLFASENIVISTTESPIVSQPAPLSDGQTVVLPRTNVDVFESGGSYNVWQDSITVGELADALNSLAVSPLAMINIFTSLRNQGALQAELVIE